MAGLTLGSSDYTLWDGQQTVTFTHVTPPTNSTATVTNAVGTGWARKEIPTDGGFIYVIEQEWFLPVAEMNGIVPAEGDYLTDASGANWWLQSDIDQTAAGIAGTGDVYCVVTRKMRTNAQGAPAVGGVTGTFGG